MVGRKLKSAAEEEAAATGRTALALIEAGWTADRVAADWSAQKSTDRSGQKDRRKSRRAADAVRRVVPREVAATEAVTGESRAVVLEKAGWTARKIAADWPAIRQPQDEKF